MIASTVPSLVAVAGNPNTGKTTLFNQLTGSRQKVGNYPGVTVDRHEAELLLERSGRVRLLDIPGTYSLAARGHEEQIALASIAGLSGNEPPDCVIVVVDATQLSRNLYLVLQVIELDVPVVVALNMIDVLRATGELVDARVLAAELGVPVVPISAQRGEGLAELRQAVDAVLANTASARPGWRWRPAEIALAGDLEAVAAHIPADWTVTGRPGVRAELRRRALALWALLSIEEQDELQGVPAQLRAAVRERRARAEAEGRQIEHEIIAGRYAWIDAMVARALRPAVQGGTSLTDRIDRVLLNPFAGFALFLLLMGLVFQSLFSWADPAIGAIETAFTWLEDATRAGLPPGVLSDLITRGLIAGVGSVLVFLPQILLLFLFLGIMEDSGYMARVAYLMDRLMRAIGLHGRAFVPMLSGYACAVPAILGTRTMERRRDRLLTMMVIPLMTCSARLPVYGLLIAALAPVGGGSWWTQGGLMVAMYLFSTLLALVCAWVLGRTLLKGPRVPLILEMPPYRMPHWASVVRMMWQKSSTFLREAGTVILGCTVLMWALLSFPREPALTRDYAAERAALQQQLAAAPPEAEAHALDSRIEALDASEQGERLRASYGGRVGHWIEPALTPLGFDWKIGIGLVGAFAAREVFVSTMGVVYGVGQDADEKSLALRDELRAQQRPDGSKLFTPLTCLSLMVFFAIACQCMSTLAVVKRESGGWAWPSFLFLYTLALAWLASFAVYQGGRLLGFG